MKSGEKRACKTGCHVDIVLQFNKRFGIPHREKSPTPAKDGEAGAVAGHLVPALPARTVIDSDR